MGTREPAIDREATERTRARYDRAAPVYDLYEGLMERLFFRNWRMRVWGQVCTHIQSIKTGNPVSAQILEVGVGTGKNLPFYPEGARTTAVDISHKMLARARRRAERLSRNVELFPMDAQALAFEEGAFDAVVSTFVFCSVPDPVLGLREVRRVLRPDGRAVFLEHMRPRSSWLGKVFDLLNPVAVRLTGANINRPTLENVRQAGLEIEDVKDLSAQGVVKLIVAHRRRG